MKRSLFAALVLSVLASTSAFADGGGGIGRAGTYNQPWWSQGSSVSRAEVKAGIAASHGYTVQNTDTGNTEHVAAQNGRATSSANGQ
ncbi:DUF4148 domain-containing protein [Paraburkholderia solisilvae]|uniref:DUF4148 domain-containing protein n=1 Tax=Paraburkholderia solisilvae TaxID=624376 RepID=A0A6J5D7D8_9BURK|nr:DUF4148 domain-containing protein [Paraburkholderia solisilvae]CAB3750188.1 hypothetical protein LMG29739_00976 [Paraburkholderia solisilvae]